MSDNEIDELGPVDYGVFEPPAGASQFTGEMAADFAVSVDAGTIRVFDVVILAKDADGSVEAMEIDDLDAVDATRSGKLIDNFRRRDHHGFAKALWFLFIVFVPIIGVFSYLVTRRLRRSAAVVPLTVQQCRGW